MIATGQESALRPSNIPPVPPKNTKGINHMKKIVSLILALALCLCALTPAMAEGGLSASAAAFPYSFEDYKLQFDTLSTGMLQVAPVWSEADGNHVATVAGFGEVVVEVNAQGQITRLAAEQSFTMEEIANAANFGMLVAMTATISKMTEDPTFFSNVDADVYSNELMGPLQTLMGRINEALTAPISSTAVVYGDMVTFTCSIDLAGPRVTYGFIYEPASAVQTETAPASTSAFDCDLAGVQQWFAPFASGMGVDVTWTISPDGLTATAESPAISPIVITLNAEGKVTSASIEATFSVSNMQQGATAFGLSIALASITVRAVEDYEFMADQTNLRQMQAELNGLLASVTDRGAEAVMAPVTDTALVGGHPCTMSFGIDATAMTVTLTFLYKP